MGASHLSFCPDFPPRTSALVAWGDDTAGEPVRLVAPPGEAAQPLPATRIRLDPGDLTGETAAYWRHAHRFAMKLLAEGRIAPRIGADCDVDWGIGELDIERRQAIAECAAAMPAAARAVPVDDLDPPLLHPANVLLRTYLDAVIDDFVRADPGYRDLDADDVRGWADEEPVSISLRIDHDEEDDEFAVTVLVHNGTRTTLLADVWHDGDSLVRTETMGAVRDAEQLWPPAGAVLDGELPGTTPISDADVTELLAGGAAALESIGVDVHWPRHLLTSRVALAPSGTPESIDLEWRVTLGNSVLTPAETAELAGAGRPVVRLRDRWVLAAPDTVRRAASPATGHLPAISSVTAALTGTVEVDHQLVPVLDTEWLATIRDRLTKPIAPVPIPTGLDASLRHYQHEGVSWLAAMTSLRLGVCLADDMGLGKTVTVIALHLHRQQLPETAGATLVVCPASLIGNWEREIERFAPGTPVLRFHGGARELPAEPTGFVLTTYGTVLSEHKSEDSALAQPAAWKLVVADEAQHIKNPSSESARAMRALPAAVRVALTGTPVENNLTDLWAILDWASPGLLGPLAQFRRRFSRPIEERRDPVVIDRLTRLIRPFVLRRRKSDPGIAPELPPKTETEQPVSLTREQIELYQVAVRSGMRTVSGSKDIARRGAIMGMLTALKQICNHPAQYLKETESDLTGRSGKLELLDELIDTVLAEDGAVLVFTQYVTMARLLESHLRQRGITPLLLHGGTPVPERQAMVDSFQAGAADVFLLSLKAGGTGLNLTRADHVIHYDRWWNPAVEAQATDRAYRIGQTRPVQVHKMVAEGTIEDRIAAMIATKSGLADSVLGDDGSIVSSLSGMSDETLLEFLELRGAK